MVDDFKFPSEITPLGENPNRFLETQRNPTISQKQISLRLGEIVKGVIIDIISPKQAIIRLPSGTFTAEISGKFRQGDELFFRVQSLEPSLVLKIYSMFSKMQGEEISTSEILRILDLPSSKVFAKVVDYLKSQGNVIIREEAIRYVNFIDKILATNSKSDLDTLVNSVGLALLLKIEPNGEFYEIYKGLKDLPNLLNFALYRVIDNAELFPREVREKFMQIHAAMLRTESFPLSIKLLSPNFYTVEGNLFNIFSKFFANKELITLCSNLGISLNAIIQGYESVNVVNSLLASSNLNYLLFLFPSIFAGSFRFFYVRSKFRKTKFEKNAKMFEFEDEELIKPIRRLLEEHLNLFFSDERNFRDAEEYAMGCGKFARKMSDKIIIKLADNKIFTFKLIPREPSGDQKVSIVI